MRLTFTNRYYIKEEYTARYDDNPIKRRRLIYPFICQVQESTRKLENYEKS